MNNAYFYFTFFVALNLNCIFSSRRVVDSIEQDIDLMTLSIEKQRLDATLRSPRDLETYLLISEHVDTPLSHFEGDELSGFVESLVFTDHGLASFNADFVKHNLSASQAQEVLELFGLQSLVDGLYAAGKDKGEGGFTTQCWGGETSGLCNEWYENYRCSTTDGCIGSASHMCNPNSC